VSTGEELTVFIRHTGDIWAVAFNPDGMTGYSTGKDGSIRVWDLSEFIGSEDAS
jgi:WD40 repeat protein